MSTLFIFSWFASSVCFVIGAIMWIIAKAKKEEVGIRKKVTLYALAGAFLFFVAGVVTLTNEAKDSTPVAGSGSTQQHNANTPNAQKDEGQQENLADESETDPEPVFVPDLELMEFSGETDKFNRYVVGKIKNNTDKEYSYVQVEISLYDGEGNQVGSTLDNVNNLAAGGTWKFKAIIIEDSATKFEIKNITGF